MTVLNVAERSAARAAVAERPADLQPVCGAIAGSGEAPGIHESFREEDRVAVPAEPVVGQPAQAQTEHARGEVRSARGVRQQIASSATR